MSVMMQSYGSVPAPAKNSSADANARAPYPSEYSASTSATRNESSSSMTAINGSLDTACHPFFWICVGAAKPELGSLCSLRGTRETIQQYHCCRFQPLWLPGFDHLSHSDQVI